MNDDIKENFTDTNIWMRLVFMLVFAVVFAILRFLMTAVVAAQFLWVLFTADKNQRLLDFGSSIAAYIYQIYRYLTFNTESRPFPFDEDLPTPAELVISAGDDGNVNSATASTAEPGVSEATSETGVEEETPAAPVRKPVRRRSPAKKTTAKKEPAKKDSTKKSAAKTDVADENKHDAIDAASESGVETDGKK